MLLPLGTVVQRDLPCHGDGEGTCCADAHTHSHDVHDEGYMGSPHVVGVHVPQHHGDGYADDDMLTHGYYLPVIGHVPWVGTCVHIGYVYKGMYIHTHHPMWVLPWVLHGMHACTYDEYIHYLLHTHLLRMHVSHTVSSMVRGATMYTL